MNTNTWQYLLRAIAMVGLGLSLGVSAASANDASQPCHDYPCWRGLDGSGACMSGVALVDKVSDAKLAWVSEDPIPSAGWDINSIALSGGLNNPVLADGRVYLTYYDPSGEVTDKIEEAMWEKSRGKRVFTTREAMRHRWLVGADDVVHCFDAATGKTLWKKTFADQAVNYNHRDAGLKTGPHMTPCVADGKIYATGALMALYCLDAKTGAVVWQNPVPERYRKIREDCLAKRKLCGERILCNVHLQCVDGVLIVPHGSQVLTGYDASTGKQLWQTTVSSKWLGIGIGPVRWQTGDKTYIIQGSSCVDPVDGRELWTVDGVQSDTQVVAVSGDRMVRIDSPTKEAPESGMTVRGYRITPAGATALWTYELGKQQYLPQGSSPMIMNGHVYLNVAPPKKGPPHFIVQIDLETGKETARAELTVKYFPVYDSLFGGDGAVFKSPTRPPKGLCMATFAPGRASYAGNLDADELYGWCTTGIYADGRVYFRRWTNLVCYDVRAGSSTAKSK